ncbi:MAG: S8 family peptidase [Butyrivibrio sp.]|nr:S8 family peptidase [Butyrivibrio sp.]
MDSSCENFIQSEEYVEFILREGEYTRRALEPLDDYCISRISPKWLLASFNTKYVSEPTNEAVTYENLPKLYGLSDINAVNTTGVAAIREQPVLGLYGQSTYVAVIDTGINWRHEAFINEDGSTRIEVMWDQESNTVYTSEQINRALRGEEADIPLDDIGHGSYMAGIAAGRANRAAGFSGVAPSAGLIVVKLRQAKKFLRDFYLIKDGVPAYSESDIIRAVAFVSDYAEKSKITVSYILGLGTSLGSHIGASPLCDILDDEAKVPGRCVTVSGGNEGNERLHFTGKVIGAEPQRVEIRVGEGERGFTCELWSFAPEVYSVEIISPSGQVINKLPVRTERSTILTFFFEGTVVDIYYKIFDGHSGQNFVAIRFDRPAAGIWTLNVYGRDLTSGNYDIWIMNRDFLTADTYFVSSDPYTTITNPANKEGCICVTAYDNRNNSIYLKNSRGYNSLELIRPDFVAPGVELAAPTAYGTSGYETVSGGSVAAAFYGGFAALLLEYGIVRGRIPFMRTAEIRNITISGCVRRDGIATPNREWGFGSVNLYNSLENLRRE